MTEPMSRLPRFVGISGSLCACPQRHRRRAPRWAVALIRLALAGIALDHFTDMLVTAFYGGPR